MQKFTKGTKITILVIFVIAIVFGAGFSVTNAQRQKKAREVRQTVVQGAVTVETLTHDGFLIIPVSDIRFESGRKVRIEAIDRVGTARFITYRDLKTNQLSRVRAEDFLTEIQDEKIVEAIYEPESKAIEEVTINKIKVKIGDELESENALVIISDIVDDGNTIIIAGSNEETGEAVTIIIEYSDEEGTITDTEGNETTVTITKPKEDQESDTETTSQDDDSDSEESEDTSNSDSGDDDSGDEDNSSETDDEETTDSSDSDDTEDDNNGNTGNENAGGGPTGNIGGGGTSDPEDDGESNIIIIESGSDDEDDEENTSNSSAPDPHYIPGPAEGTFEYDYEEAEDAVIPQG